MRNAVSVAAGESAGDAKCRENLPELAKDAATEYAATAFIGSETVAVMVTVL